MPNQSYEFLKPVLGDELFAQFDEKMNSAQGITLANIADGSYIPKNKFDEVNTKLRTANTTINTLKGQLETAQGQSGDAEGLRQQIETLKGDIATKDATIASIQKQHRVMEDLRGMGCRNPKVVMSLLDLEKISEKDGKLEGLTDQTDALRKSDGYLFANVPGSNGGFAGKPGAGSEDDGNINAAMNTALRSAFGRS